MTHQDPDALISRTERHMTDPQDRLLPQGVTFTRAGDALPEPMRPVIVRFKNGETEECFRLPPDHEFTDIRNRYGDTDVWGVEEYGTAAIDPDHLWADRDAFHAHAVTDVPHNLALTAGMILKAAGVISQLSIGIFERRDHLDQAARLAMLSSADLLAFVASLVDDGLIDETTDATFRARFDYYDIDHAQLQELSGMRRVMTDLIRSGAASPYTGMDAPPPPWPAEARVTELETAIRDWAAGKPDAEAILRHLAQPSPAVDA